MDAVAAYYAKLPHTNTADDADALLAFIKKDHNQFSAAGIYDGQVWARFSDGDILAIANAQLPAKTKSSAVDVYARRSTNASPPLKIGVHCKPIAQPSCPRAYVLANTRFFSNENDVAIAKALGSVGYDVISNNVTVDQLKLVKNAHVLEIDSHGVSIAPGVDEDSDNGAFYGVVTATPVTANDDVKYAGDIADGSILYGLGAYLASKSTRYALLPVYVVTPKFFQKYVTFQNDALDDSLAFLNACLSASNAAQQTLMKTLVAKGLATYLGWAESVNDHVAIVDSEIFYNRVLPEDVTRELIPVPHTSPPESASDVMTAYNWMVSLGITGGTGDKSNLKLFVFPPKHPQLAPILDQVNLFEYNKDQPGTPWIAGAGEWGSPQRPSDIVWGIASEPLGTITAFPSPLANYLGAGDVRSILPLSVTNGYIRLFEDGISSNAIPLTEWDGTVTVSETQTFSGTPYSGSVTLTANLNVGLRDDVNPIRLGIESKSLNYPPTFFTDFMPSSSGTFGGTGTYSDTYGGSPATYQSMSQAADAGSNPSASSDAVFDAAQPGGTYAHTCGSVNNDSATACLWITGNGSDVATCQGGTFGGGSICPYGPAPSAVMWMFGNYNFCGPSGEAIPFTVNDNPYSYALSAPEFSCPSGFLEPPPTSATASEASEKTTYTFTFHPPKSPPTINTATGVETPNSGGAKRVKAKTP
jgi:hypothetical protein